MFSQLMPGYTILVRKTFEQSNDLEGVTVFNYSSPAVASTITGERGTISFSPDYRKLIMDLANGEIHEQGIREGKQYRRIRFEKHRISMDAEGFDFHRSQEGTFDRGDRELSAGAMQQIVDSLRSLQRASEERTAALLRRTVEELYAPPAPRPAQSRPPGTDEASMRAGLLRSSLLNDANYRTYIDLEARKFEVEIHKKYAIPFACIVFVLIGAPLAIRFPRGGPGMVIAISLAIFGIYYVSLIGGESLGDKGKVAPFWGPWAPNILFLLLSIWGLIRIGRETSTSRGGGWSDLGTAIMGVLTPWRRKRLT